MKITASSLSATVNLLNPGSEMTLGFFIADCFVKPLAKPLKFNCIPSSLSREEVIGVANIVGIYRGDRRVITSYVKFKWLITFY